ncbi:hypothetical protein M378DRAFT_1018011 [Amanita muscaria Koide BX008]|uniref:FBD domain-containing protein n=1 Tax=Amanita muscaria (strain Koide BX008) TaxID=946122 RepID=A0A0C2WS97_AMAMK|nr:hypothetical protein M378DRAFT_1018011 [Amanita muscaria Koide BX008]
MKKRNGVESIRFCGVGENLEYADEELQRSEPQFKMLKIKRDKWLLNQRILNQLVKELLSGNFYFPRLTTVIYDASALLREDDAVRFMVFLRRNPGIRNIIVEGDNTRPFGKWTFSRLPNDLACGFRFLERARVYGPLLPLLLGFSFSPNKCSGELGPLIRPDNMPDTLPLKRVHLWWPQRTVHVVRGHSSDNSGPLSVELDLLDLVKALSSVCRSTLEVLVVKVDDQLIDEDLIGLISSRFSNLRELEFGPSRSNPLARLPNPTALRRIAETLSGLKHLTRFGYRILSHDSEERLQHADVLEHGEHWNDIASHFAQHCPCLQFITLYSLTWRAAVLPFQKTCWG